MSNEMFTILLPVIGLLFLISVLWGPTALVVFRQRHGPARRYKRTMAFSFLAELVVAASLSFLADRVGLLNPAGYVLAILFIVGMFGAFTVHRLLSMPANPSFKRDALKRAP